MMKRNRAKEIRLTEDLSIRYTYHAISTKSRKSAIAHQTNRLTMYLYSSINKKRIGKETVLEYSNTKKQNRRIKKDLANSTQLAPPRVPPIDKMEEGIFSLFDKISKKDREEQLTDDVGTTTLAKHWLKHYEEISNCWKKGDERIANQKLMMHMVLCFGDFDLTLFLREDGLSDEDYVKKTAEVVKQLRREICLVVGSGTYKRKHQNIIRESLEQDASYLSNEQKKDRDEAENDDGRLNAFTNRMAEYSKCLWHAIEDFLWLKGYNEVRRDEIGSIYSRYSQVRHSKDIMGISRNLVRKVLGRSEYHDLYYSLIDRENPKNTPDVNKAALMAVFMGLSASEICALKENDIKFIPGYDSYNRWQACYVEIKREIIKRNGRYVESNDLNYEKVRCVPIPEAIYKIISPINKKRQCLFLGKDKKSPLMPKELNDKLQMLFDKGETTISHRDRKGMRRIDLSFQPKHLAESCSHLWEKYGLEQGEIRYLIGKKQAETVYMHYIDFQNAHELSTMCVHLSAAMNSCISNVTDDSPVDNEILTFCKGKERHRTIKGVHDRTIKARIRVVQPATIQLAATYGLTVRGYPKKED